MKSRIAVSILSLSVAVLSLILGGCSGVSESDPVSTPSADNTDNSGDTQSNMQTSVTLDPETQKLIDEFSLEAL